MELWRWEQDGQRVLLLHSRGKMPGAQELGQFLCRSLTIWADRLLIGPTAWRPEPEFLRLDWEGVRIPADHGDAAAFLAFLSAAGYGAHTAATDGLRTFHPELREIHRWRGRKMPEEEQNKLLSLG